MWEVTGKLFLAPTFAHYLLPLPTRGWALTNSSNVPIISLLLPVITLALAMLTKNTQLHRYRASSDSEYQCDDAHDMKHYLEQNNGICRIRTYFFIDSNAARIEYARVI